MAASTDIDSKLSIRQLAADIISRKEAKESSATVILGAGASVNSGIPTWAELAEKVCRDFHIEFGSGDIDAITVLAEHFNKPSVPYNQRYTILQRYLKGKTPSIGYSHLAQLVKDGLISTILTTNWDPLMEKALVGVIPYDQIKVLIRGEIPDDIIAEVLEWRRDHPTIIKLHGDLQSRRFMMGDRETRGFDKKLSDRLVQCISTCTFMVGQSAQDVDILSVLIGSHRQTGSLYHVRYGKTPSEIDKLVMRAQAQVIQGERESVLAEDVRVNIGDFDAFFTQLDIAVQLELTGGRRAHLRKAENSILDKERTGVGYINYARITDMVQQFTLEVKRANPDLILFINDPSAPGGMELRRRMIPIMDHEQMKIPYETIEIRGQSRSRTHERAVTSNISELPMTKVRKVLVLDAITFSGNTLKLARDALRKQFPHIVVQLGVLVISNRLYEEQKALQETDQDKFLSHSVTDRYEIFFPWGVTQTTSTFSRVFEGATEDGRRQIRIEKRPWGAIEVLVNEEMASVRLLTIEAGCKLSFQRHLCRDELFVALDDNIGLDICADDVPRDSNEYNEAVKSLILEKDDYVLVPRGVWHRTKASMDRVRLLEVGFGLYDQDNDIERRWDDYKRERKNGKI